MVVGHRGEVLGKRPQRHGTAHMGSNRAHIIAPRSFCTACLEPLGYHSFAQAAEKRMQLLP
jgi:hypothetical protein